MHSGVSLELSGIGGWNMKRELAAILFADVVGYSRLAGLDEEQTHTKLETGFPSITV